MTTTTTIVVERNEVEALLRILELIRRRGDPDIVARSPAMRRLEQKATRARQVFRDAEVQA